MLRRRECWVSTDSEVKMITAFFLCGLAQNTASFRPASSSAFRRGSRQYKFPPFAVPTTAGLCHRPQAKASRHAGDRSDRQHRLLDGPPPRHPKIRLRLQPRRKLKNKRPSVFSKAWLVSRTMKIIKTTESVKVPKGVKVTVRSRVVTVKGKRGTLRKDFKHLALDIKAGTRAVHVTKYFGIRKELAAVRTYGYRYKLNSLHAHFPINIIIGADGSKIKMFPGIKAISGGTQDTLQIEGNDVELVSKAAALIQQSCQARHKDIRKFLDGVYVSHKGTIEEMA
ncbi:60S ribosomal protein L9 [Sparganum proliferum]